MRLKFGFLILLAMSSWPIPTDNFNMPSPNSNNLPKRLVTVNCKEFPVLPAMGPASYSHLESSRLLKLEEESKFFRSVVGGAARTYREHLSKRKY